jgi:hypothetical protein
MTKEEAQKIAANILKVRDQHFSAKQKPKKKTVK